MSWLAGLASKAEDLLNRVDQTAASALQIDPTEPHRVDIPRTRLAEIPRPRTVEVPQARPPYNLPQYSNAAQQAPSGAEQGATFSPIRVSTRPLRSSTSPTPTTSQHDPLPRSYTAPMRAKNDRDAALFQFLNSAEPAADDKAVKAADRPRFTIGGHSRKSSASSTKSESIVDLSSLNDNDTTTHSSVNRNSARTPIYRSDSRNESPSDTVETPTPGLYKTQTSDNDYSKSQSFAPVITPSSELRVQDSDQYAGPAASIGLSEMIRDSHSPAVMMEDDAPSSLGVDVSDFAVSDQVKLSTYPSENDFAVQSRQSFENVQQSFAGDVPPSRGQRPEPKHEALTQALQRVSSLELENKLLRSEVSSLNTEIGAVVQREKSLQQEMATLATKSERLLQSDAVVREMESRECDYRESIKVKDHQIGVLRVRLEEMDTEMAGKNQAIAILEGERERLLRDHTDSRGVQSQALENLQSRLSETDMALRREQEAYRTIQREFMERQTRVENDQKSWGEQLNSLHKKLQEEKNRVGEQANQLRAEKQGADMAKQELADYKEKAARILQSKDRLIASLKDGGAVTSEQASSASLNSELDEVRNERDMYREELQAMSISLERLRQEMADLESQMQTDHEQSRDHIQTLDDQLASEKRKRDECEQEILKQKQEIRYVHEELLEQRCNFQAQIGQKDNEIERLSSQLSARMTSNTSQAELENRLRALTENLIQKQTTLEAISTEKTSLALQLERMERRYRDNEAVRAQAVSTHAHAADDDVDVARLRLPLFMKETSYDTNVTRGMKRAANTVDRFSIRLGVFLRRYPIARIFVIVYMLLLHLWVSVVLLTYQPEIHDVDHALSVYPVAPETHH